MLAILVLNCYTMEDNLAVYIGKDKYDGDKEKKSKTFHLGMNLK